MMKSLMQGLTEKDMQAVVNTLSLNDYIFPTLFPLKEQSTLTWKSLELNTGLHIAADMVARNASLNAKSREALARMQGDIPKIAIKRIKDEDELNEYRIALAMAGTNPDEKKLVEAWAEDVEYCFNGVASRLEWIGLQSISRGLVSLTKLNNVSVVSEYDMDYQMGNHRQGYQSGSAAWSDTANAKPVTKDFRLMVERARADYNYPKFVLMNQATFAKFCETEEVIKMCASWYANLANATFTPSLDQVNQMLKSQAYLYGLQIKVIDQEVTIELADGSRSTANPFVDDSVLFAESLTMGNTYWKRPADMDVQGSAATRVMRGYACIKKYADEEPLREVTIGVANAIPGWTSSSKSWLMDCEHNSFTL